MNENEHRQVLEQSVVHVLATAVAGSTDTERARSMGAAVRAAIDGLLTPPGLASLANDVNPAGDVEIEAEIQATGQTGRRVRYEQIDALMQTVTIYHQRIEGTCSTVALAVLPNGFTLAIGHSACVDPAMFNAELGAKIAAEDAFAQARKALWQFEGYALKKAMEAGQ